jgi:hypothetical protein
MDESRAGTRPESARRGPAKRPPTGRRGAHGGAAALPRRRGGGGTGLPADGRGHGRGAASRNGDSRARLGAGPKRGAGCGSPCGPDRHQATPLSAGGVRARRTKLLDDLAASHHAPAPLRGTPRRADARAAGPEDAGGAEGRPQASRRRSPQPDRNKRSPGRTDQPDRHRVRESRPRHPVSCHPLHAPAACPAATGEMPDTYPFGV